MKKNQIIFDVLLVIFYIESTFCVALLVLKEVSLLCKCENKHEPQSSSYYFRTNIILHFRKVRTYMFTFSYIYINKEWKAKQETGYLWKQGFERVEKTWKQEFTII